VRARLGLLLVVLSTSAIAVWQQARQLSTTTMTAGSPMADRGFSEAAAFDGGFVLVWEDDRAGSYPTRVWGARFARSGAPLDATSIELDPAVPLHQWDPAVRCVDRRCLVAWGQDVVGPSSRLWDVERGTFGTVVHLSPTARAIEASARPSIATDGTQYLVVWRETIGRVAGRFVSLDGLPLGPSFDVATAPSFAEVSVVWGEAGWAIAAPAAYGRPFPIWLRVLDRSGTPTGPTWAVGETMREGVRPALAAYDGGFITAFFPVDAGTDAGEPYLAFRRFGAAGPIDPAPVVLDTDLGRSDPVVWLDGDEVQALWTSGPDLEAMRFNVNSYALVNRPQVISQVGWGSHPRAGPAGSTALVSWWAEGPSEVPFEGRFGAALVQGRPALSATPVNVDLPVREANVQPRVSWAGANALIGWTLVLGGRSQMLVRAVEPTGAPLGPAFSIATGDEHGGADLVFDGRQAWVAFSTGQRVRLQRLDEGGLMGQPIDLSAPVPIVDAPRAAASSALIAAAWVEEDTGSAVLVRLARTDGGLIGASPTELAIGAQRGPPPSVAVSVDRVAVAYQNGYQLFVALLDHDGTIVANTLVGQHLRAQPSIASDGKQFLVLFTQQNSGDVKGFFVDGPTLTPQFLVAEADVLFGDIGYPTRPRLAFDGTTYLAVWSYASPDGGGFNLRSRALFVDGGLGPIEVVTDSVGDHVEPAIAVRASSEDVLFAWVDPSGPSSQVFVRARTSDAGPAPDGGAADSGTLDAGATADAGSPEPDDGGTNDAGLGDQRASLRVMSCAVVSGPASLTLGLVLALRRRRALTPPSRTSPRRPSR